MSNISPEFVLKQSAEAVTDLNFWIPQIGHFKDLNLLIASYGDKGGVNIWDLKTRRIISNLEIENPKNMLSGFGVENGLVVTLDKQGILRVVDLKFKTPKIKTCLSLSSTGFCKPSVVLSKENHIIVAVPGEEKSSCNIWDLTEGKLLKRFIPPPTFTLGMLMCIQLFLKHGKFVFVGYEDGSILCWDFKNEKIVGKAERIFTEPVMCFDIITENENNFIGISGSATNDLIKWKIDISKISDNDKISDFEIVKTAKILNPGIASVKIRLDKKIVATGGWDYKVRIFSWKTLKPLAVLEYHTGTIQSLAFSDFQDKSDNLLACGSTDHKISVWKLFN